MVNYDFYYPGKYERSLSGRDSFDSLFFTDGRMYGWMGYLRMDGMGWGI